MGMNLARESQLRNKSCWLNGVNTSAFVLPSELKVNYQLKGEPSESHPHAHGTQIHLLTGGSAVQSRRYFRLTLASTLHAVVSFQNEYSRGVCQLRRPSPLPPETVLLPCTGREDVTHDVTQTPQPGMDGEGTQVGQNLSPKN